MIIDRAENVASTDVKEENIKGINMKVLIGTESGASNFVMRVFEVGPGGHTAYHTHPWEHEVYVLGGTGIVKQGDNHHTIKEDSFAFVPAGEEHQFINQGDTVLRFICVVPVTRQT
jgi:quercetin dioxygenase-like cupin family protein